MSDNSADSSESFVTSSLSAVAIGAVITFIGSLFVRIAGFLERIVIAQLLGPNIYGKITLGLTILNLGVILGMAGFGTGLVKVIPTATSSEERRSYVLFALRAAGIASVTVAVILIFLSGFISEQVFHGDVSPELVRAFAAAVPLSVIGRLGFVTAQGSKDARARTLIKDFAQPGARMLFVVGAIIIGIDLATGLSYAYLAGYGVFAAVSLYYLYTTLSGSTTIAINRIQFLRYSVPLFLAGGLQFIADSIDSFLIGAIRTVTAVGIYNSAYTLANQILFAPSLFSIILMPIISESYENNQLADMDELYRISTRWTLIITIPGYLALLTNGKMIVTTVFGSGFRGGTISLLIVASGFLLFTAFGLNIATLNMMGDSDFTFLASFVNVGVNILLNLYLIPRYGIEGAAVATAVSFAISNTLVAARLYALTGIVPHDWISIKSFAMLTIVSIIVYLLVDRAFSSIIVPILMYGCVIIVFIPIYYYYFATPAEREIAAGILPEWLTKS